MRSYRKKCAEPGCKGFVGPNGKKFCPLHTLPAVESIKPELVRIRKENAALREQLYKLGVPPCV